MAEWLCSGLQSRVRRFDSGFSLQNIETMIGIIDSKICNIFSVENALNYLDINFISSSKADDLQECTHLILPGVGTFDEAMKNLEILDLIKFIESLAKDGRPLLGICLGMQLLFEKSEEGSLPGLGLIPGEVKKFPNESVQKIPHIGWNSVDFNEKDIRILNGIDRNTDFYFIHSFYTKFGDEFSHATCEHEGFNFKCVVQNKNIFGTQFHPEKSQDNGLAILRNFIQI